MKKVLYLIRLQGWRDSPLTATVIQQAKIPREYFTSNEIF